MWKGKDQTTIYLNFSQIHRGPKNGQTVTRPLPWERSDSVVECFTRDRKAASSSPTGITALWSLSKTHLSWLSTGSAQEDLPLHNWKIVDEM